MSLFHKAGIKHRHTGKFFLLTLLLTFGLLTGCNSSTDSSEATDPSSTDSSIQEEQVTVEEDTSNTEETDLSDSTDVQARVADSGTPSYSLTDIPAFSGSPYVPLNNNVPFFTEEDLTTTSFETYSPLDSLGRCGVSYANVGQDLMPTEKRGSIGQVKPSGWHTIKYDIVDGKYLYNRCHLIGYQLTAENANTQNLITGTRYLNVEGMLPFENLVADYINETDHHVLYRVTPVFDGDNLVASGVILEAESVEDKGEGVLFCVYCYNAQPGITINYATGDSELSTEPAQTESDLEEGTVTDQETSPTIETAPVDATLQPASNNQNSEESYVLNTNTHKFHKPGCSSVKTIKDENRQDYTGNRSDIISMGYEPCKKCNP